MLQRIGDALKGRDGSKHRKWITYLVVGVLLFVFAAWGAYGIVNLNFGGSNYAAEANGSKIPIEDARNVWLRQQTMWQQRLGSSEMPPELRARLQDQVLESLIRNALLTQRTHDLGYRVSHDQLREAVQQEQAFQVDGQYSPEAARAALAQAGISLETYEQQLRTEVQAYYKEHLAQYMTPESAHLKFAELRLETLAAQQSVSDADLHAAYEKNRNRLEVPERRHARHILITGKDDAAA